MPGPGMFGLGPFFFTFCSFYSCTSYLNACSESFLIAILCLIGCGLGVLSPLCVGGWWPRCSLLGYLTISGLGLGAFDLEHEYTETSTSSSSSFCFGLAGVCETIFGDFDSLGHCTSRYFSTSFISVDFLNGSPFFYFLIFLIKSGILSSRSCNF